MENIFAKSGPEWITLLDHLQQVTAAAEGFALHLGMDVTLAKNGAVLHDIGKTHPVFQKRLREGNRIGQEPFRHEIASLFFLSAFPKDQWNELVEMVVSHHKSLRNDVGRLGLLDLDEECDYEDYHLGNFGDWSASVWNILSLLGIPFKNISKKEAIENLEYCIEYCQAKIKNRGYSQWKGLLMGADHFASALINNTQLQLNRTFKNPDLSFYNRQHPLYPLSYKNADLPQKHTIVVACTGAGKTDYLFRRCKGRVFYTLPFQASINAMFKRVAKDLRDTNEDLDIRVLHSTSKVVRRKNNEEEIALQSLMGSSIKILTPHQLASLAFGMNGYEALMLDLKGCDIILDEVHTYTGVSQAIVLKIVEILKKNDCRIHIGTATMPTILYKRIKTILGEDVLEVKLNEEELDQFDRHIIYKLDNANEINSLIKNAIDVKQKVLIVQNKVKNAQEIFKTIQEDFPNVPSMLLHSRFKRGDRNEKEKDLIGLDEDGHELGIFNTSNEACIVVSTQIVEVSLDISFDMMITECAPLDAMIQRFGRINRKRTEKTIGNLKDIYVLAPPENKYDAKPYDFEILQKSFEVLEDGKPLRERELQEKIDTVFTSIDFLNIEQHSVFKSDGNITIDYLTHNGKAILFDLLEIDSVSCITESDVFDYENGDYENRLLKEIPTYYYAVSKMRQSKKGNNPFIIPDSAYCPMTGLDVTKINKATGVFI